MSTTHHTFLQASLFAGLSLMIAAPVFGQQDVIDKRQKLMKEQSAAAKAIKGAVEAKDYATIEAKAKDLVSTADKIVEAFPKGSTKGKTKAKDDIWAKPDEFSKNAKDLKKAASELADAAKAKDPGMDVKVKAVGDVCSSCHKAFRAEKYSE
jgi:cytochrome c556